MDFFSTIPIDYIYEAINGKDAGKLSLFGALKLGRLLRINKLIQFMQTSEDVKAGASLFNIVFFLIIYLHCFACALWMLVKNEK